MKKLWNRLRWKFYLKMFSGVKFRKWAELENKKQEWVTALIEKDDTFPDKLYGYLSILLKADFNKLTWVETVSTFYKIHSVIQKSILPIPLLTKPGDEGKDKVNWDYPERLWYFYSHVIAQSYGWSPDQIAQLEISDGLAYIQEIFTDEYQQNDFLWSTSEVAYSYDKATKKSKYNKLPTPYWMRPNFTTEKPKPIKIEKSLIPMGNVVSINEEIEKAKPSRSMEAL